ncbi:ribosomal protein uL16 3-hydroxylase [Blastomonas aquatica]|uniref:Cupin n=1 Tax=Blastomonas aquatica TaxID=1510276 RepID=A0ABQ1J5Q7_9SPHN|nr:cupin domain-containing protein [Blastomonas aquatica]GGB59478.1 cupin [Blastomonas aquatica]
MKLAHFNPADFLATHWQRAPLLIRNPWDDWACPVEADELAGLACEPQVEARLIEQTADADWTVEHGPLAEDRFATLGKTPWTLLVQAVDHHMPQVAALLAQFRFVPNWRVDDVMVSFASDGGGVGPHFDQYDVFLIQGQGRRRWQIGSHCGETSPLLPHGDLKLLRDFSPTQEWVLEPGDMLYVPPGVSHNGIALGDDCMTLSIGFRAPSRAELIGDWSDHLLEDMSDDDRFADPGLALQANPGEIGAEALAQLRQMMIEALGDEQRFARWFGAYSSTRKYPDVDWRPEEPLRLAEIREAIEQGMELQRNPASRFAFVREGGEALVLFVDGETFECSAETSALGETICANDTVRIEAATDAACDLLQSLCNMGSVAFVSDDDEDDADYEDDEG